MTTFKGDEIELKGSFLYKGNIAPNFVLVNDKLETITLEHFAHKDKLLVTVPSMDTPVCASEAKRINEIAKMYPELVILIISKDLPFAQKRYCKQESLHNIITLSDIKPNSNFSISYGVLIHSGPLEGLLARSVIFLNNQDRVTYSELVDEITHEPNYESLENYLANHYQS